MNSIIDLRETSPNNWRAMYEGNYGVYTIKLTLDGERVSAFSCTCPSGASPCKHIGMIKDAILERVTENRQAEKDGEISVDELLKAATHQELYHFIARLAKNDSELRNAITLEFSPKASAGDKNIYALVLRKAFRSISIDTDDCYDDTEYGIDFQPAEQWLYKAKEHIQQGNYGEAVLIAKAFIEEYADWVEYTSGSFDDYIDDFLREQYQKKPFEILRDAAAGDVHKQELYDYCMTNMAAEKYKKLGMSNGFITALSAVALTVNPDAFIALQDKLLAGTADKTSHSAEKILQRKIDFYHQLDQPEKAWKILEDNIQIESFRKQVVDAYITNKRYAEAKKLILDFTANIPSDDRPWSRKWDLSLLDIAMKQKDIPLIRELSFMFIKDDFKKEYFNIYKSAFSEAEWKTERERLIAHYQIDKSFNKSVADLLVAEKLPERLLNYTENYLSIEYLEQYHTFFAADFPEKTIRLFRLAIDKFAERSVGRATHRHIITWLNMMSAIKGGKEAAAEMANEYRVRYKTRKLLLEMLRKNGF